MERSRTDYYRVLQVDPAANPLVIQAAYRVLARIFHPDVQGDDEQMKRLNRAWEVLGDAQRRAAYDIERAGRHPGPVGATTTPSAHAPATRPAAAPASAPRTADVHAAFAANAAGRATAPPASAHGSSAHAAAAPAHRPASSPRQSEDHAGPPRGEPYGPVLKFGRYEGWSLGQIARVDQPFLEWLRRVPAGRGLKDEIDAVLRSTGISGVDRRRYDSELQKVHTWAPGAPTKLR